ncbi:LysR family transcriptional regulator [Mameliella alba]|nr:LysR family transcriptional regulator [Antarctobacter heliothermus]MBY6144122.1 LysR family transcriptional regulator [Mameliella alba]MCA0954171.1 LysR family transcriptional regulator [Mameliella alba]
MTDDLDWTDVRYFLETARAGRFSGAARRLGVSHTTVARRVSRLETVMRNRLLEPGEAGLIPTEAGTALIPLAERMESQAEQVLDRLQRPGALTGRVRIGAPDGFGNAVLSRILPGLTRQEPELDIELVPVPAAHKLWNREVDIAISLDRPETGRLVLQKLTDYDLRLYAAPGFLRTLSAPPTRADMERLPMVGYIDELLYTEALDFNRLVHPNARTRYKAATVQAQMRAIEEGVGLGVLPCFMARDSDLVPVLPQEITFARAYWLLCSEADREIVRIRRVIDFLRDETRKRTEIFRFDG